MNPKNYHISSFLFSSTPSTYTTLSHLLNHLQLLKNVQTASNPDVKPNLNPTVSSDVTSDVNPGVKPNVNPDVDPDVTTDVNPDANLMQTLM